MADEKLSVIDRKALCRHSVNNFCINRLRHGLQCKDCPANNTKLCDSIEYWKKKSLRTIMKDCEEYGIEYDDSSEQ